MVLKLVALNPHSTSIHYKQDNALSVIAVINSLKPGVLPFNHAQETCGPNDPATAPSACSYL
jgi:hypothetical protein